MIKELKKTFEYLPKLSGEEQRELSVYASSEKEFYLEMTIRATTQVFRVKEMITAELYEASRFEIEESIIKSMCVKFGKGSNYK